MTTTVNLKQQGPVARVVFETANGVHLLSADVRRQLSDVVGQIEQLDDCRVVVFESVGRTFIAGADIHEFLELTAENSEAMVLEMHALLNRITRLPAVTLTAIHAACVGGGCELAFSTDMRMAAESARIGLPEVTLGIIPGWGGVVRATRLFGPAVAKRLTLTGELLAAEEAFGLGIVDSVFPDDKFRDAVDARVQQILKGGPQAQQLVKQLIEQFSGPELEQLQAEEAKTFVRCFATGEPYEGSNAFLEKRNASWNSGNR